MSLRFQYGSDAGTARGRIEDRDRVDEAVHRPALPPDDEVDGVALARGRLRHVRRARRRRVIRLPRRVGGPVVVADARRQRAVRVEERAGRGRTRPGGPAVEQKKSGCCGPENIGPVTGWFTSSASRGRSPSGPGPARSPATVLAPSGRPVSTPSSACGARSSAANDEVTSTPFSLTVASASGTVAGTTTRTRAAPPLT